MSKREYQVCSNCVMEVKVMNQEEKKELMRKYAKKLENYI